MKTKLVLWGTDAQEERILIAMQLRAAENKVDMYFFKEPAANDEFAQQLMDHWRNGQEVPFPEDHQHLEQELTVTESLLPEDVKVERGDVVQRAQTEWHFVVLSSKLHEAYESELDELKQRVEQLEKYDQNIWEELKTFWSKVQEQMRDRNLFRDHSDALRERTNELFARMKELRSKMDDEFRSISKEHFDSFNDLLKDIEDRLSQGSRLAALFEELKGIQRKFRDTKFTREHRSKIWQRLDAAFKAVKEQRFGKSAARDSSPLQRLERRYEGLLAAIAKMEKSIRRDHNDLEFQKQKIDTTDGQLEAQIRQAKILMIEERVRSKEEKLNEMHLTKQQLEKKMEILKEKEARKKEQEKIKAARKAAKEKIADEIKKAEKSRRPEEEEKLEKAADALTKKEEAAEPAEQQEKGKEKEEAANGQAKAKKGGAKKKEAPKGSLPGSAGVSLEEALEDVVDTAKAVAFVVGERFKETMAEIREELSGEEE